MSRLRANGLAHSKSIEQTFDDLFRACTVPEVDFVRCLKHPCHARDTSRCVDLFSVWRPCRSNLQPSRPTGRAFISRHAIGHR